MGVVGSVDPEQMLPIVVEMMGEHAKERLFGELVAEHGLQREELILPGHNTRPPIGEPEIHGAPEEPHRLTEVEHPQLKTPGQIVEIPAAEIPLRQIDANRIGRFLGQRHKLGGSDAGVPAIRLPLFKVIHQTDDV